MKAPCGICGFTWAEHRAGVCPGGDREVYRPLGRWWFPSSREGRQAWLHLRRLLRVHHELLRIKLGDQHPDTYEAFTRLDGHLWRKPIVFWGRHR